MVGVRRAAAVDAAWMQESFDTHMGWTKRPGYFATCCEQQAHGAIVLLVAHDAETYLGHTKIVWEPGYAHFRQQGIPEIQDLNVLPQFRRQGIATQLLDVAEATIRERSALAGIGFGLYADYGPAQRLYTLRGYVPDGQGAMSNGQPIPPGSTVTVDDDLILYLTRDLE